jgi:hypothetical protein
VVPIHLKFQGLWVGAALGELYATGLLKEQRAPELRLSLTLSKTRELCETAAHCLNAPAANLETLILEYERSQDLLLALLPLAFLHRAGIPGLSETLARGLAQSDEPEKFASAIAITHALDWFLNPSRPPQNFIRTFLKTPDLQNTATAAQLESVQTVLTRYESFQPSLEHNLSQDTLDRTIGQVFSAMLSTPDDFRLTLQRAAFWMPQQPELLMLVGALSGLHNGLRSLPLSWRLVLRTIQWDAVSSLEDRLLNLANLCAAQWAGCYTIPSKKWSDLTIAPPGHLCPR